MKPFFDADWASAPDDWRSTFGSCIYLALNHVSWWSKKQPLVVRSSTEAEYRSLTNTASELMWIQTLLQELDVAVKVPAIYFDNLRSGII